MIENETENAEARKANPTTGEVWIGLYRVPWIWSDKSQTFFRPWHSSLNNAEGTQHCGTENELHQWADEKCTVKRPFICHQGDCWIGKNNFEHVISLFLWGWLTFWSVLKKATTVMMTAVRMKFETNFDWTDPATNSQILRQVNLPDSLLHLNVGNGLNVILHFLLHFTAWRLADPSRMDWLQIEMEESARQKTQRGMHKI